MKPRYRSSIPVGAVEKKVLNSGDGCVETRECFVGGELVGLRVYWPDGTLASERPIRDGRIHGVCYDWHETGALELREPYRRGFIHGVAAQWDYDGTFLGTYEMHHGTGFDVWRGRDEAGRIFVAEIHTLKSGKKHSFTWWMWDRTRPYHEEHYWEGKKHGIERAWNANGRLQRGYPKYWVADAPVRKRDYLRACAHHEELPPFRSVDQRPTRRFPAEVRALLRRAR